MEKLTNLEEYKAILKDCKKVCRGGYNNFYLDIQAIKRYLSLGRIYYEVNESGVFFFTDEEQYYRLYAYISPERETEVKKQDKPVLIRNIYREQGKPEALVRFEEGLKKQGFTLYDQSVQIISNPLEQEEDIRRKCEKALSFLKRAGLTVCYAKEEHLGEMIKLRQNEPLLKPYHFMYQTEEEMKEDIQKGYYRCVINQEGRICAAQQFSVQNGTLQGNWLAVKEEYKVRYGIGTAMAYHSFLYAIEHQIPCYFGWVVRDNVKSLKYHQAIGYKISDKLADEWFMQ